MGFAFALSVSSSRDDVDDATGYYDCTLGFSLLFLVVPRKFVPASINSATAPLGRRGKSGGAFDIVPALPTRSAYEKLAARLAQFPTSSNAIASP
jgi:hypothetical protein